MPKREPKEKVACQDDPALPKEGRKRRARGISVLPNLSLGKREIYQDLESS